MVIVLEAVQTLLQMDIELKLKEEDSFAKKFEENEGLDHLEGIQMKEGMQFEVVEQVQEIIKKYFEAEVTPIFQQEQQQPSQFII